MQKMQKLRDFPLLVRDSSAVVCPRSDLGTRRQGFKAPKHTKGSFTRGITSSTTATTPKENNNLFVFQFSYGC